MNDIQTAKATKNHCSHACYRTFTQIANLPDIENSCKYTLL